MSNELVEFLSQCTTPENDKDLILSLEDFLAQNYLIRPILVYSIQKKQSLDNLIKCRLILGKNDRLDLYSKTALSQIVSADNHIKEKRFEIFEIEGINYYYLNLGLKRNQFHFAIFTGPNLVPSETLTALSLFCENQFKNIEKVEQLKKANELIYVDDVTGLFNQRKLLKDLSILVDKFQKEKDPFCVLFIDIDYFKKVNDNYGHLVGTKLLEDVARDIRTLLRETDMSYRYGGDEFVVVLTSSDASAGKIVGERILSKIKSTNYRAIIQDTQKDIQLSVSVGVAEFPSDALSTKDILAIADRMMYEAKESGRGIVFNTQDIFRKSLQKVVQTESKS